MSGYSDPSCYESEAERNAVCAELARMLRIVPLTHSPIPASPSRDALPTSPGLAGVGDLATEHQA